jgi:hypothetical protein
MLLFGGLCTARLLELALKLSGIKRWSVLKVWVTDPRRMKETELILAASGVWMVMLAL